MSLRPVPLLLATVAAIGANSMLLSPISAAIAADFRLPGAAEVMTAQAGFGLGTAVSATLLAPLVDRLGADRALWRALLLFALGLLGSALAAGPKVLLLAQTVAGVAVGVALPAAYALAAHVARPGREARTIGAVLTGWTVALVGGISLGAVIADLVHWRAVYVLLLLVVGVLLLLLGRHDFALPPPRRDRDRAALAGWRVPGIGRAAMVAGSFMLAFYGFYAYVGAHATEVLHRSVAEAGLVTVFYGTGFGLGSLFTRWIDEIGRERLALPVYGGIALVYLGLAAAAEHWGLFLALCLPWGIIQHFGLNMIVGRMTALDPARRGAILGINSSVTYLAVFGGTLGFRPLYERGGLALCAMGAAVALLPAIVDALAIRRRGGLRTDRDAA